MDWYQLYGRASFSGWPRERERRPRPRQSGQGDVSSTCGAVRWMRTMAVAIRGGDEEGGGDGRYL